MTAVTLHLSPNGATQFSEADQCTRHAGQRLRRRLRTESPTALMKVFTGYLEPPGRGSRVEASAEYHVVEKMRIEEQEHVQRVRKDRRGNERR